MVVMKADSDAYWKFAFASSPLMFSSMAITLIVIVILCVFCCRLTKKKSIFAESVLVHPLNKESVNHSDVILTEGLA